MKYFKQPFRFVEPETDSDVNGPHILDANGGIVAKLFWPGHPPEETAAAEQETYALGRAMVLAEPEGGWAVLQMRDQFLALVHAYNAVGEYGDAADAQVMAVALNKFEEDHVITDMEWPPRLIKGKFGHEIASVGKQSQSE